MAGNGWLPIETAPKDGTPVLVYVPGKYAPDDKPNGVQYVAWKRRWVDPDTWEFYSSPQIGRLSAYATHWQPLPDPPEARGDQPDSDPPIPNSATSGA